MPSYGAVLISGYSSFYNELVPNRQLLATFPVWSVILIVEIKWKKKKKKILIMISAPALELLGQTGAIRTY